jgi:hypothetical protein
VSDHAAMPALGFLAVVGLALIGLLFVANVTLEPGSPVVVQRTAAPAPAPNMTSQAVLAAQAKVEPAAHEARAERLPAKRRVTRERQPVDYQQPWGGDRFSIKGY